MKSFVTRAFISLLLVVLTAFLYFSNFPKKTDGSNSTGIYIGKDASGNKFEDVRIDGFGQAIVNEGDNNIFSNILINSENRVSFFMIMISIVSIPWWPVWWKKIRGTYQSSKNL